MVGLVESYPFREHKVVLPEELRLERAQALAQALQSGANPFARLEQCRADVKNGTVFVEAVVLEVDVELSQYPAHDVRSRERLAVLFLAGDDTYPEVLALRSDFPLVPHLNLRPSGYPPSLCLYDLPFEEVHLDWRAPVFVEQIRSWLAQTADGQLHAGDQPLEPLLFAPLEDLVLPEGLALGEPGGPPVWLSVKLVTRESGLSTAITQRRNLAHSQGALGCVALVVSCPPQTHGVIRHHPLTLDELHDFVATSGLNLLDLLRWSLKGWLQSTGEGFEQVLEARLILVVQLPKTRLLGQNKAETVESRAFFVGKSIRDVGVDIGVWALSQGQPGLLLPYDEATRGGETPLFPLNPRAPFSRSLAARVNGFESPANVAVAAIGAGALGSQIVCNLVRAGFGQWKLIDRDILLPHNLGRHALFGPAVGHPKATALAELLNGSIEGGQVAEGIVADVLRPGEKADQVRSALSASEVILDMSASVPVARHLCHDSKAEGRRISLFLNPSGSALTMLAEDKERRVLLDTLEMQLYRAVLSEPGLSGLLESGGSLRTGQSCRDVSVRIPQDLVALHAAIGSRALRTALSSDAAQIITWLTDGHGYTVSSVSVTPALPSREVVGEWTVQTDSKLREKLASFRQARLPKETGGVLIGAYDLQRKVVYVVDAVASPPDSLEQPDTYVRGTEGLRGRMEGIHRATAGMLDYVGEWHSHPDGSGLDPGRDDRNVLVWLGELMDRGGAPVFLAIVGNGGRLSLHMGDRDASRDD